MEAYRLKTLDMMGFTIEEKFYLNKEKALEKFDEKLDEYRKSEDLASDEDAKDHSLSNKAISISENQFNHIKSALICLWYRCNHEVEEYDTTVHHLELEEIEIN